ncbi:hypothetical protein Efla_001111 [Eimeria flavescens]
MGFSLQSCVERKTEPKFPKWRRMYDHLVKVILKSVVPGPPEVYLRQAFATIPQLMLSASQLHMHLSKACTAYRELCTRLRVEPSFCPEAMVAKYVEHLPPQIAHETLKHAYHFRNLGNLPEAARLAQKREAVWGAYTLPAPGATSSFARDCAPADGHAPGPRAGDPQHATGLPTSYHHMHGSTRHTHQPLLPGRPHNAKITAHASAIPRSRHAPSPVGHCSGKDPSAPAFTSTPYRTATLAPAASHSRASPLLRPPLNPAALAGFFCAALTPWRPALPGLPRGLPVKTGPCPRLPGVSPSNAWSGNFPHRLLLRPLASHIPRAQLQRPKSFPSRRRAIPLVVPPEIIDLSGSRTPSTVLPGSLRNPDVPILSATLRNRLPGSSWDPGPRVQHLSCTAVVRRPPSSRS